MRQQQERTKQRATQTVQGLLVSRSYTMTQHIARHLWVHRLDDDSHHGDDETERGGSDHLGMPQTATRTAFA